MNQNEMKSAAAAAALEHVRDGMKLGIGTGSTAEAFVHQLAARVANGLTIIGVPTSERTAALCRQLSIPLATLDDEPQLDLTIDGADELDSDLNLIKGGGGALLREKIVAAASHKMIVIADASKLVGTLGAYPLPIEVNRFGLRATENAIRAVAGNLGLSGSVRLRGGSERPFTTDGGHLVLDASFGHIRDAVALSAALHGVPGVVEHGLFIGLAGLALIARPDGVQHLERAGG
jgi:ribose 5-phosphate isomerase A